MCHSNSQPFSECCRVQRPHIPLSTSSPGEQGPPQPPSTWSPCTHSGSSDLVSTQMSHPLLSLIKPSSGFPGLRGHRGSSLTHPVQVKPLLPLYLRSCCSPLGTLTATLPLVLVRLSGPSSLNSNTGSLVDPSMTTSKNRPAEPAEPLPLSACRHTVSPSLERLFG